MSAGTAVMRELIDQIFDKALSQHSFTDTYAKLCSDMSRNSDSLQKQFVSVVEVESSRPDVRAFCWRDGQSELKGTPQEAEEHGVIPFEDEQKCNDYAFKQTHFKRILLNKCQEEFEKEDIYEEHIKQQQEEERARLDGGGKALTDDEKALQVFLRKRERKELRTRRLGNTLFIGSLFKLDMLSERIMHNCITELMGDPKEPDVESVEALCKLLVSIGYTLDDRANITQGTPKQLKKAKRNKDGMRIYFETLQGFSVSPKLDKRTQFMCRDVLDMRKAGWKERRKTLKVKTLAEVHAEAAEEERQAERQARRGGGNQRMGGGRHNHSHNNRNRGRDSHAKGAAMAGVVTSQRDYGGKSKNRSGDVRGGPSKVQVQGNLRVNRGGGGSMRPGGNGMRPGGSSMRPGGGGGVRPGRGGPRSMRPGGSVAAQSMPQEQQQQPSSGNVGSRAGGGGSKSSMSLDELKKKCSSIVKEYIGIRDASEAEACMKELPERVRDKSGEILVGVALDTALNCKAAERPLVEDFVVAMVSRKVISGADVSSGSVDMCEFLQDMKVDMPLCDVWLGRIFGKMLGAGINEDVFGSMFNLVKQGGGLRPEALLAGILLGAVQVVEEEHDDVIKKRMITGLSSSEGFCMLESSTAREFICEGGDFRQGAKILDVLNSAKEGLVGVCSTFRCAVRVQTMLTKEGRTIDEVLKWVSTSVPGSILSHPNGEFGRLVCSSVTTLVTLTKSANPDEVARRMSAASSLLKFVLDGGLDAQVAGLAGVAHVCEKLKFRSVGDRSLMDVLFRTLYEIEAVLEAAVHGFAALLKKDKRKAKALSQIQTFVTYLETAEEEA
jgi:translation initiation factor 4G